MAEQDAAKTTHRFQAEVNQVLSLVINSLYSNKEIFLRELLSNASDALDKLRFRAVGEPELLGDQTLKVAIIPDREAGTLEIWDNGIGMTEPELIDQLGTIAKSGSRELLEKLTADRKSGAATSGGAGPDAGKPASKDPAGEASQAGDLPSLIGQFGVGFYSAYLVADHVEVRSRAAGEAHAHRWSSDAKETFSVERDSRAVQGTSVILHLKEEAREYLESHRLNALVRRYSDYLAHPIELVTKGDDGEKIERVNSGQALWQRSPKEIAAEQYEEFYKHLTHDFEAPLAHKHFHIEGTQLFRGLLFMPRRAPFDLFAPDGRHGVRLHVKRVFIMDDCEELLPRWLRFIRGVIDSEDLPLNVSREILQDSAVIRVMRKQIIKQSLDMLKEVATERVDDYAALWRTFGAVIKEGLHFEPEHADRLKELVRYQSSHGDDLTSLAEYKGRMAEGQPAIYYALGESRSAVENSPHLEALKKRGYEVLYMVDAVDQWAISGLGDYDGMPMISVASPDLKLPAKEGAAKDAGPTEAEKDALSPLLERMRALLQDDVSEVRLSDRLTDSPVCLVVPDGGLSPYIERLLRASQEGIPKTKRILEVNPEHSVIDNLLRRHHQADERLDEWIKLLFDQALLAEGSPLAEPASVARRLSGLLLDVTSAN